MTLPLHTITPMDNGDGLLQVHQSWPTDVICNQPTSHQFSCPGRHLGQREPTAIDYRNESCTCVCARVYMYIVGRLGPEHDVYGIKQGVGNVLVLARTGSIFVVAKRGQGQDLEVIQYCLHSLLGVEERDSLAGRRGSLQLRKCGRGRGSHPVLFIVRNILSELFLSLLL